MEKISLKPNNVAYRAKDRFLRVYSDSYHIWAVISNRRTENQDINVITEVYTGVDDSRSHVELDSADCPATTCQEIYQNVAKRRSRYNVWEGGEPYHPNAIWVLNLEDREVTDDFRRAFTFYSERDKPYTACRALTLTAWKQNDE